MRRAAWFSPLRTTEDLDLIGLGGSQTERFDLMQLAADAAIPIEAVNSAADFYVRRIPDWRDQLVELLLIEHVRVSGETLDRARVVAELDALPATIDMALVERRAHLRRALTPAPG